MLMKSHPQNVLCIAYASCSCVDNLIKKKSLCDERKWGERRRVQDWNTTTANLRTKMASKWCDWVAYTVWIHWSSDMQQTTQSCICYSEGHVTWNSWVVYFKNFYLLFLYHNGLSNQNHGKQNCKQGNTAVSYLSSTLGKFRISVWELFLPLRIGCGFHCGLMIWMLYRVAYRDSGLWCYYEKWWTFLEADLDSTCLDSY